MCIDATTRRSILAACAACAISVVMLHRTFNEDDESGEEDTDIEESDTIAMLGHEDDESGEEDTDIDENDSIANFGRSLLNLAEAIKGSHVHWSKKLMQKLLELEIEGFDEMILERAFDALYKDEMKGKGFIGMPRHRKLEWIKKFVDGEAQN